MSNRQNMAKEEVGTELKTFLQFQCENKVTAPHLLIKSTLILLRKCYPARQAVLDFFAELFDDIVSQYCEQDADKLSATLLARIFRSTNEGSFDVQRRMSVDSTHEAYTDSITPQSPPPVDNCSPSGDEMPVCVKFSINAFVDQIRETLTSFASESDANYELIMQWTLETTTKLSSKYAKYATTTSSSLILNLSNPIKFWLNCPVISLLLNLMQSRPSVDLNPIIKKIVEYSPNSDWICAHLLTSLPSSDLSLFARCIESLVSSNASQPSVTAILSYLSEYNPQAIINSSKSNIPFLLKLCSNSAPLLHLLATEAVNQINVQMLNDLSKTLTEDLKDEVIYCIMNAPNAYDLLVLVFEACSHKEANEKVTQQALRLLATIAARLHEFVFSANISGNLALMDTLKENYERLIVECVNRSNNHLRKLQIRILQLLCIHFGVSFATKVIHKTLDSLMIDHEAFRTNASPHPLLISLTRSLKLPFGSDVQSCFKNAIKEPVSNSPRFWANLLTVVESDDSIEMDIDLLTMKLMEHMSKDYSIYSIFYILRLIQCFIEKDRKTVSKPNHHLCVTLVHNYMQILESIENDNEDIELKFLIITNSQKCMASLSTGQSSHQHILCRALIESEFHRNETSNSFEIENDSDTSLMQENMQYGHSLKFRKIPLIPNKRDNTQRNNGTMACNIRRQLLYDAVRCCVVDIPSFASLLVECITPDVMFNNLPWPDEDFLKVTIERDLHIARKFEKNPILWDFCGFIAKDGCLHYCSVLIRALMAVQLTQWASATASKEKLGSTQKLVTLIANSELVPNSPFKYLPQIMPSLTPWEIFCVLNDLWRYMKDNSSCSSVRHLSTPTKPYLERLRIILSQKFPGHLYVKIFKGLT